LQGQVPKFIGDLVADGKRVGLKVLAALAEATCAWLCCWMAAYMRKTSSKKYLPVLLTILPNVPSAKRRQVIEKKILLHSDTLIIK